MSTVETAEDSIDSKHPIATVNTAADGSILGVTLFLGRDDLAELEITDADHVAYGVKNGDLQLRGVTKE